MYSQGFQQSNVQNQASQYRGLENKYQPVGFVQSQYNAGGSSQFAGQSLGTSQPYASFQNQQSYHTANYRGNQQGHDTYLRADSTQPAQSQFGIGSAAVSQFGGASQAQQFGQSQQFGASSFGATQQFGQQVNPQSYHTANYKGNQPGHDNQLRADSTQPAQSQFGIGSAAISQFGGSFSQQSFGQQPFGQQSFGQQVNPQSYHTANYRGNQQGHDNQLRADSTQPAQSQFGMSNRFSF